MNNALKYAKASTVRFQVRVEEEMLVFRLQDDGLGFDQDKLVRVNGLNNMAKRAEEMKADFSIEATPGLGTSIQLQKQIYPNG
jgi:signal transduction histidine kinase